MSGGLFSGLLEDLQLRVALFLGWHEACAVWSATLPLTRRRNAQPGGVGVSGPPLKVLQQQRQHWRSLIAALIDERGHDEDFLADLSTLQDVPQYKPVLATYAELHPERLKAALSRRYAPERLLERIFACDDAQLLSLVLDTHKRLTVDAANLAYAVEKRAARCLSAVLAESRPNRAGASGPRVRLEGALRQPRDAAPGQQAKAVGGSVDFRLYPQSLLWRAAFTRDSGVCDIVVKHLQECAVSSNSSSSSSASPQSTADGPSDVCGAEDRLRYWAACCGAASGQQSLLSFAGPDIVASRVSFVAPAKTRSGGGGSCWDKDVDEARCFEEAPLAVVACASGHVDALRHLAKSGVDLNLCTRRGWSAWDAAQRHSGDLKRQLLEVLRRATACEEDFHPGASRRDAPAGVSSESPVADAIERGDLARLRTLLRRGARLEAGDIMSAVRSGDLEVLAFVQSECAAGATNTAEYRQMVRQTAQQIRAQRKAELGEAGLVAANQVGSLTRSRSSPTGSSSRTSLRQAGDAVLGFKSTLR